MSNNFTSSYIHPVELEFTKDRLREVNSLADKAILLPPHLIGLGLEKSMFSILLETFEKLRKAEVSRIVSPPKKEKFKLKLKPHQAYFLEVHIRNYCNKYTNYNSYLHNIADQINQKLA